MTHLIAYLLVATLGASQGGRECSLEGSWKSDLDLSLTFNQEKARLDDEGAAFLRRVFGHMEVRFKAGESLSYMPDIKLGPDQEVRGFREEGNYEVLYCSSEVAVVLGKQAVTGKSIVTTYNFPEPGIMWVYIGNVDSGLSQLHLREYFRSTPSE